MRNQISLSNLINFVKGYNIELTESEAREHLNNIKMFLLTRCRKGSKVYNSICNITLEGLKGINNIGLYNRLVSYKTESGYQGRYIAGQDYTEELKTIKKYLCKEF